MAFAGAGYWSFVGGALAGTWASALVAVARSPYPLRLRYDRGTLRRYATFSWPLLLAGGAGIVTAQGSIITGNAHLGHRGGRRRSRSRPRSRSSPTASTRS